MDAQTLTGLGDPDEVWFTRFYHFAAAQTVALPLFDVPIFLRQLHSISSVFTFVAKDPGTAASHYSDGYHPEVLMAAYIQEPMTAVRIEVPANIQLWISVDGANNVVFVYSTLKKSPQIG